METVGNPEFPAAAYDLKLSLDILLSIGGIHFIDHPAVSAHKIVTEQADSLVGGINQTLDTASLFTDNAELIPHLIIKNHSSLDLCRRKRNLHIAVFDQSLCETVDSFLHFPCVTCLYSCILS